MCTSALGSSSIYFTLNINRGALIEEMCCKIPHAPPQGCYRLTDLPTVTSAAVRCKMCLHAHMHIHVQVYSYVYEQFLYFDIFYKLFQSESYLLTKEPLCLLWRSHSLPSKTGWLQWKNTHRLSSKPADSGAPSWDMDISKVPQVLRPRRHGVEEGAWCTPPQLLVSCLCQLPCPTEFPPGRQWLFQSCLNTFCMVSINLMPQTCKASLQLLHSCCLGMSYLQGKSLTCMEGINHPQGNAAVVWLSKAVQRISRLE